jgi:hypothetical protein
MALYIPLGGHKITSVIQRLPIKESNACLFCEWEYEEPSTTKTSSPDSRCIDIDLSVSKSSLVLSRQQTINVIAELGLTIDKVYGLLN